ncbi:MAG: ATP-binding protein [Phycisphaerae bacterium]
MVAERAWLRRFLTAEEVPRWFGLSLVLIYLVGIGSVAHYGIVQARRESATHYQRTTRYAVSAFCDSLSALPGEGLDDPGLIGAYQRSLREFAAGVTARVARIVDADGRVWASTDPGEIGATITPVAPDAALAQTVADELEVSYLSVDGSAGRASPELLIRARIDRSPFRGLSPQPADAPDDDGAAAEEKGQPGAVASGTETRDVGPLYLEARLPPEPVAQRGLADHARALAIVLVVLGALFVVYRCLREQLRGVSRIADRLQSHGDSLEEEISSLRVADTLDGVTATWNQLIDMTQQLLDNARRTEANAELSRVLERSAGGALADALNAVPDGFAYIVDEDRFEYANASACHFFGWTEDECKSITLGTAERTGVAGKALDLLCEARQPDGSFEARSAVLTADGDEDGTENAFSVRISPLRTAQKKGECVVLIRDVSQNVRADRAREDFLTQVTHELRTPLTNIRAYAETLSSGMFDDPNVITECYNVITKETRRLARLVEDILSVSQLEVGTMEMHLDSVDLKTLLNDGVRDVRGFAEEQQIDLQLVLPPKLDTISGDRDKLAVVVNNLLGNAIKYTPPNGHVMVGAQVATDEVLITVKDNGIGIDPADHARVFEKFQRAADPQVQNETGTGIGLYTAREIVRHHGGDIELISEKGKGSTFLVRLPHHESRAAAMTTAEVAKAAES